MPAEEISAEFNHWLTIAMIAIGAAVVAAKYYLNVNFRGLWWWCLDDDFLDDY